MKPALLLYIPPPKVPNTQVFLDHFTKVKVGTPVIWYSEHDWKLPNLRMMKADPERWRNATTPDGQPNKFAIPNVTFFTGLRIAMLEGFSHVLVVEPDCRFGRDYWDLEILEEFANLGTPCIAAGSLATYNPCNWSPLATKKWEALIARNQRKNFPVTTYGWKGAGQKGGTMVFPNGALAVYDMTWMKRLFPLDNTVQLATSQTAWDFAIGQRIWDVFAEQSYDVVGLLNCIYSGYGDLVSTEQQRQQLLMEGKICAVHQVKSAWVPS